MSLEFLTISSVGIGEGGGKLVSGEVTTLSLPGTEDPSFAARALLQTAEP